MWPGILVKSVSMQMTPISTSASMAVLCGVTAGVPVDAQRRRVDVGLPAGHQLGEQLATGRRQAHPDVAATARDVEVVVPPGPPDERQAVRAARTQPGPHLSGP